MAATCMIRGDFSGTLKMQRQMLEITQEDWTTEGELVDSIQRRIRELQMMLAAES